MKAVVAAFNQEKALVGAFSVITNLRMELFEAVVCTVWSCVVLCTISTIAHLAVGHQQPVTGDCIRRVSAADRHTGVSQAIVVS